MSYVFPPAAQVSVPVAGSDAVFPVRRVYCVGQNYADHAAEMGADGRNPPFFFSKPADALVPGGGDVAYPPATDNLQHEVELVVALSGGGAALSPAMALECVFGYSVGIDLTRRDLQQAAKGKGHPWDMSKGFDQSAPIAAIQPLRDRMAAHPEIGNALITALLPLITGGGGAMPMVSRESEHWYASWRSGTMDFFIQPLPFDDGVHTVSKISPLWAVPDDAELAAAGIDTAMLGWTGGTASLHNFLAAISTISATSA